MCIALIAWCTRWARYEVLPVRIGGEDHLLIVDRLLQRRTIAPITYDLLGWRPLEVRY